MLVDTMDKLQEVMPDLLACMDPAVDTETTGLDAFGRPGRSRDHVIGISIDTGTEAYYFPFRHEPGLNLPNEAWGFFRSYLSDPHRCFQGFNYGFDLHMLAADRVPIAPNFEDAMLALHLINENEPSFKLKEVCDRYGIGDGSLQESILEDKVFERCREMGYECSRSPRAEHNTKSMMYVLPPSDVEPYACDDVRLTRQLMGYLREALDRSELLSLFRQVCYYDYCVIQMEERGMHVDRSMLERYRAEAEDNASRAVKALHEAAGFELNPNSPNDMLSDLVDPDVVLMTASPVIECKPFRKEIIASLGENPEDRGIDPKQKTVDAVMEILDKQHTEMEPIQQELYKKVKA